MLDIIANGLLPAPVSFLVGRINDHLLERQGEQQRIASGMIVDHLINTSLREANAFFEELAREIAEMFDCFLPHLRTYESGTLAYAAIERMMETIPGTEEQAFERIEDRFIYAMLHGNATQPLPVKNPQFEGLTVEDVFQSWVMVAETVYGLPGEPSTYSRNAEVAPPDVYGYTQRVTEKTEQGNIINACM